MQVVFEKGENFDFIEAHQASGAVVTSSFPKKGVFPHDAVHLIVERELNYKASFWGRVFAGARPEDVAEISKAGGHSSASRAEVPDQSIVELIQTERIVECFEAEMWSSHADIATFRGVLAAACSQSKVECPLVDDHAIKAIRLELTKFFDHWRGLEIGESVVLEWH